MKKIFTISAIISSLGLLYFYPYFGVIYILGALTVGVDYYKSIQTNKELIEKLKVSGETNIKLNKDINSILTQLDILEKKYIELYGKKKEKNL